jgi:hypothetical protein
MNGDPRRREGQQTSGDHQEFESHEGDKAN